MFKPSASVVHKTKSIILGLLLAIIFIAAAQTFVASYAFNWGHIDDFLLIIWYKQAILQHEMSFVDFLKIYDNDHLLAAQALISWIIFALGGINFDHLVWFNFSQVVAGAILLAALLLKSVNRPVSRTLAICIPVLIMLHPIQIPTLLWAFQIGWFSINFILILNVFLLEQYGEKALPFVVLTCVIATFSSAHGIFLWPSVALHMLIRPVFRYRWHWTAVFFIGFGLGILAILRFTHPQVGGVREQAMRLTDLYTVACYFIRLLGSVLGTTDPVWLGILGLVGLILAVVSCWNVLRKPEAKAAERAGVVFIVASWLFMSAFTVGRYRLGLPWALVNYHAGLLPLLCLCGMSMIAITAFDQKTGTQTVRQRFSLLPCLYCICGVITFLPLAPELGRESMIERALAMQTTCSTGPITADVLVANGLAGAPGGAYLAAETMPLAKSNLCTSYLAPQVLRVEREPELFAKLGADSPVDARGLADLWHAYLVHHDLMRAFPFNAPATGANLILFGCNVAVAGGYLAPLAGEHDIFVKLHAELASSPATQAK